MRRWLLPEYIEDVLPAEARRIEALRRTLLDLFRTHGYELVMPPLLEYLESLLTGTGHDLDLKTFKLVDQLSGRMLGLRADITPQVARIDAHLLNRAGIARLCYAGSVLHALPSGMMHTREPLQIGAELYGHAGVESDIEVVALMLAALHAGGIAQPRIDLGHVGVFRALSKRGGLEAELEQELFAVLQAKDMPDLRELVKLSPRSASPGAILAPWPEDKEVHEEVERLRCRGETVVLALPGHEGRWREAGCDRKLTRRGAEWIIENLKEE